MSAEILSKVLFEVDPARTCCKENDCFDEYDRVAKTIIDDLNVAANLFDSIDVNLWDYFEIDLDQIVINTIIDNYNEKLKDD